MIPWLPVLATLGGLACGTGNLEHCGRDQAGCAKHAGLEFLGVKWPRCPVREVLDDPHCHAVLEVDRLSQLAPISRFPDRYAAWFARGWAIYREQQGKAREHWERIRKM